MYQHSSRAEASRLGRRTRANAPFVLSTVAAAVSALVGAFAQAQAPEDSAVEEVVVTGSRIRQTNGMAAPTPVTVLTPEELQSYDPGGTIAEQLDALPQFFATQTAQRGGLALSGDAGASFLNMRSLGTNRTLVLLDGARMAPADKRGSVNVDTFPTALVRTVDVVTGGASAAYGADALGGVTNFIIDRNFQGLKINTSTGVDEFGEGRRWQASIAGGFQIGERLNIIGSIEDRHIDQIDRDPEELDQDWFRRWGHVTNPEWFPGAPPGVPQRLTMPWIAPTDEHPYGMISDTGTELDGMHFNREGTELVPFVDGDLTSKSGPGTTQTTSGGPEAELALKANPSPISGAEVVGRALFLAAKYDFTDRLSMYAQVVDGRSESNRTPRRADISGINMTAIWAPRISVDNAFLPQEVRDVLRANGLDEFNLQRSGAFLDEPDMGIDQRDHNVFTTRTYTVGFDYALTDNWDLSGSYSDGETERLSSVDNMMRVDRMFLGMDAVEVYKDRRDLDGDGIPDLVADADRGTGDILCRVQVYNPTVEQLHDAGLASGLINSRTVPTAEEEAQGIKGEPLASPIGLDNTVSECVPYNVMGFGNINPEAIEYVGTPKYSTGIVEQDFLEILATGDVHKGWGYGPVSMAAGLTWRESSFSDGAGPEEIDALGPPLNVPKLGIRGIPPGYTGGSPNLHQFSTVPLISGEYNVWEWFTEFQAPFWASPSGNQRIGGSIAYRSSDYNLSGRSESWKLGIEAQIVESLRFRATKSRDVREASFSERFDAQGGGGGVEDPEKNGERFGITVVASGNPNLRPEIADTLVAGFVFQPTWAWADGLSFSGDWYSVDIADSIEQIGAQDVVDRCFAGDTEQCGNIIRDPVTGTINSVFRRFFNLAQDKVEGIDFEVVYRTEPDLFASKSENLSIRVLGGKLLTREDTSADGVVTDRMGSYNLPELTTNLTLNYGMGPWSFQMQGRYISDGKLNRNWVEGVDVDDNTVPSSTWWNGRVGYRGEMDSGATWNVSLFIQNVFDKHPPIIPSSFGQTVSNQYDIFGRRYNLSVNFSL
ncbi:MAG TPA: TonB-dependent receptor [Gammaproteobacteria bacterium]